MNHDQTAEDFDACKNCFFLSYGFFLVLVCNSSRFSYLSTDILWHCLHDNGKRLFSVMIASGLDTFVVT